MARVRVTACELPDDPAAFDESLARLEEHVKKNRTDVLVLNEMPASPWLAHHATFRPSLWRRAVKDHDRLVEGLGRFAPAAVLGARPIDVAGSRRDQGFLWTQERGYHGVHDKAYFPDEAGFYEARWFDRGVDFEPFEAAGCTIGLQICTELMFNEWARRYGRSGVHLIANPRAGGASDRWEVAARMAAIASGAYVVSSNRAMPAFDRSEATFGGQGRIVDPDGKVLAVTSARRPFVTAVIDTAVADVAKQTYPRDVPEINERPRPFVVPRVRGT